MARTSSLNCLSRKKSLPNLSFTECLPLFTENHFFFTEKWETNFYTPPLLGDAALFDDSPPAVYKNLVP